MAKREALVKNKKEKTPMERQWHRYQFIGTAKIRVPGERTSTTATISNISVSGICLYSPKSVGKGKAVKLKVSFIDSKGRAADDTVEGKVDWQSKFKGVYLVGVLFDEELNMQNQPKLMGHLSWLIDTFTLPQPYKDRRIATL
jgi:hypothetical protein